MQRIRFFLGAFVFLGACTSFDEGHMLEMRDLELGGAVVEPSTEHSGEDGGRTGGDWIINGLSEPSVSGVDPQFPLDSSEGLGADGWLGDGDPEGKEVLRYLVECALAPGDSVTVEGPSDSFVFEGALGLAPEWTHGPCNNQCQQWVSACLLARANEGGNEVRIFIQGDHPELGFGVDPDFAHYEATFFGNVFSDPESLHACRGTPIGMSMAEVQGRTCALDSEECGFTTYDDCVEDAGCTLGPGGLATIDCQPDPMGPSYSGIAVNVGDVVPGDDD